MNCFVLFCLSHRRPHLPMEGLQTGTVTSASLCTRACVCVRGRKRESELASELASETQKEKRVCFPRQETQSVKNRGLDFPGFLPSCSGKIDRSGCRASAAAQKEIKRASILSSDCTCSCSLRRTFTPRITSRASPSCSCFLLFFISYS